ncbi:MAG TPA: Dps family protein [Chlamydiales bacterium]|nr:DNA starvation/stationary phase protection protein [Chlamydiales bacterium]HPE84790.1 Dps family protein [Chlamydiales bacterium]
MDTALSEEQRKQISAILYELLASTYSFYLKTQNYHWNLRGKEFYSMHLLFQNQYEELAGAIDEMAERIRALGHHVEGGLGQFKKKSFIQDEEDAQKQLEPMIRQQIEDHEAIIRYLRKHLPEVERVKDGATADFINKRLAVHEKMAWMFRCSL